MPLPTRHLGACDLVQVGDERVQVGRGDIGAVSGGHDPVAEALLDLRAGIDDRGPDEVGILVDERLVEVGADVADGVRAQRGEGVAAAAALVEEDALARRCDLGAGRRVAALIGALRRIGGSLALLGRGRRLHFALILGGLLLLGCELGRRLVLLGEAVLLLVLGELDGRVRGGADDQEDDQNADSQHPRGRELVAAQAERRDRERQQDERDADDVEEGLHGGRDPIEGDDGVAAATPAVRPRLFGEGARPALADDGDLDPARVVELLLDLLRGLLGDHRGLLVVDRPGSTISRTSRPARTA